MQSINEIAAAAAAKMMAIDEEMAAVIRHGHRRSGSPSTMTSIMASHGILEMTFHRHPYDESWEFIDLLITYGGPTVVARIKRRAMSIAIHASHGDEMAKIHATMPSSSALLQFMTWRGDDVIDWPDGGDAPHIRHVIGDEVNVWAAIDDHAMWLHCGDAIYSSDNVVDVIVALAKRMSDDGQDDAAIQLMTMASQGGKRIIDDGGYDHFVMVNDMPRHYSIERTWGIATPSPWS